MGIMKVLDRINKILDVVSRVFVAVVLLVIVMAVISQVISRYVYQFKIAWTQELATYLYIWMIFIGASLGLHRKEIVAITFLRDRMNPQLGIYLNVFNNIIVVFFLVVGIIYNCKITEIAKWQHSPVLNIPMNIVALSFTVSGVFMVSYLIEDSFNQFSKKTT